MGRIALVIGLGVGLLACSQGGIEVSRSDYGEDWPLTVESGRLECRSAKAVVFHTESTTYAVNGTAIAAGYPKIDPIWRDHPEADQLGTDLKVNIGPLIDRGLALCKR